MFVGSEGICFTPGFPVKCPKVGFVCFDPCVPTPNFKYNYCHYQNYHFYYNLEMDTQFCLSSDNRIFTIRPTKNIRNIRKIISH